jgi:competence protein ComEA
MFVSLLWLMTFTAQVPLPAAPAKKVVEAVCGACHDVDTAVGERRTKAGWRAAVDVMVNRGARATDEELGLVIEYLARYFGIVNVNRAAAQELEEILEVSPQTAQAIVQFRSQNGDFADLDQLKKVPGLDTKLIDERKDRITFK